MNDQKLKHKLYVIIFESDTPSGKLFDVVLIGCILASVLLVIIESLKGLPSYLTTPFVVMEYLFTAFFTFEYLTRIYCSPRPKKYIFSFFGIVDLLATLPLYIGLIFPGARYLLIIRAFRLIRVFRVPKVGARIMSLANPEAKMSKSENDDPGRVCLMDKPEDIMRLFKRAITDCESEVRYDPEHKKGVSNLMTIYSAATGRTFAEIEAEFAGHGYGDFKKTVGEAVVELLRPIREESQRLLADKAYLQSVCESGAQKAAYVAEKTLRKVYKKVGFVAR